MPSRRANGILYLLATVLSLAVIPYHLQITVSYLQRIYTGEAVATSPWSFSYGSLRIYQPNADAARAGVRRGDLLTEVNGLRVRGYHDITRAIEGFRVGSPVHATVISAVTGEELRFTIPLPGASVTGWSEVVLEAFMQRFMPWVCVLLALWVLFVRPRDQRAWILAALLFSFSGVLMRNEGLRQIAFWPYGLRVFSVAFHVTLTQSWPIWMCLFGLTFPEPFGWLRRRWVLLAPAIGFFAVGAIWVAVRTTHAYVGLPFAEVPVQPEWFSQAYFWLNNVLIGAFFASLGVRKSSTKDPDGKRRILILYAGAAASLTPIFLLVLYAYFSGREFTSLPAAVWLPGILMTCLFPLVMAYVILVERAMDVRVAIRRGIQYALAKGLLLLLRFALIVAAVVYSVRFTEDPWGNLPQFVAVIALTVAAIIAIRAGANKLQSWVDRRFFREAYNAELVLTALAERVLHLPRQEEILQSVCATASETLHVPEVAALVEHENSYRLAFATQGAARWKEVEIPRQALEALGNGPGAIRIPPPGASRRPGLFAREDLLRNLPRAREFEMLVPIAGANRPLGLLLFGRKQSEAPYSLADQRLLELVARQTGLALENSRLAADVAQQIAAREMLQREIDIAREIQQRLLPSRLPAMAGVELAGFCEPAQSVGGDYFDFLTLEDGRLAIAIGDVAGKGIPAALLMASVQASLRGLLAGGVSDVAEVMTRLNRLVYDATPANRFVTLFFGVVDPDGHLAYVSAGHCTALLSRAADHGGRLVEALPGRGPALGLLRTSRYAARQARIHSGDVLVAYTDGVLEAMNPSREEFGEERVVASLRNGNGSGGAAAAEALLRSVKHFTEGAAPHDDLTVIAVGRSSG